MHFLPRIGFLSGLLLECVSVSNPLNVCVCNAQQNHIRQNSVDGSDVILRQPAQKLGAEKQQQSQCHTSKCQSSVTSSVVPSVRAKDRLELYLQLLDVKMVI